VHVTTILARVLGLKQTRVRVWRSTMTGCRSLAKRDFYAPLFRKRGSNTSGSGGSTTSLLRSACLGFKSKQVRLVRGDGGGNNQEGAATGLRPIASDGFQCGGARSHAPIHGQRARIDGLGRAGDIGENLEANGHEVMDHRQRGCEKSR
jgi:hypothetical protein